MASTSDAYKIITPGPRIDIQLHDGGGPCGQRNLMSTELDHGCAKRLFGVLNNPWTLLHLCC